MQLSPDAELCYRARYTHIGKLHKLPQRRSVMRRAVMTGTRRSEIARSGRPPRKLSKEAAISSTCTVSCSRAARQAALKELRSRRARERSFSDQPFFASPRCTQG